MRRTELAIDQKSCRQYCMCEMNEPIYYVCAAIKNVYPPAMFCNDCMIPQELTKLNKTISFSSPALL